jgi:hypothetical protein
VPDYGPPGVTLGDITLREGKTDIGPRTVYLGAVGSGWN